MFSLVEKLKFSQGVLEPGRTISPLGTLPLENVKGAKIFNTEELKGVELHV